MLMCVRRTTIVLDDGLYRDLRRKAVESGTSMKAIVNNILRDGLRSPGQFKTGYKFDWPSHGGGLQPGVDIDNWNSLEDLMDGIK